MGGGPSLTSTSVVQCVPNTYAVLIVGRMITGLGFGCVYVAT